MLNHDTLSRAMTYATTHAGNPPISLWDGEDVESTKARSRWIEKFQTRVSDYIYHYATLNDIVSIVSAEESLKQGSIGSSDGVS
jgi:hypothetical protein